MDSVPANDARRHLWIELRPDSHKRSSAALHIPGDRFAAAALEAARRQEHDCRITVEGRSIRRRQPRCGHAFDFVRSAAPAGGRNRATQVERVAIEIARGGDDEDGRTAGRFEHHVPGVVPARSDRIVDRDGRVASRHHRQRRLGGLAGFDGHERFARGPAIDRQPNLGHPALRPPHCAQRQSPDRRRVRAPTTAKFGGGGPTSATSSRRLPARRTSSPVFQPLACTSVTTSSAPLRPSNRSADALSAAR